MAIDLSQFLWIAPISVAASPLIFTVGTIASNEWIKLSKEERRGLIWGTVGSILASTLVTVMTTILTKSE